MKNLTWSEYISLARRFYSCGGDVIVETCSPADFLRETEEFGPMTEETAMKQIRMYGGMRCEP